MISRHVYDQKMGDAILLTNSNIKKAALDLIYDRICKNYINSDFEKAIEDVSEGDNLKLSYPVIMKRLNLHRSIRLEEDAKNEALRAEEESRQFWNMDQTSTKECTDHRCGTCPRKRCDTIAAASVAGIKAMLSGEISCDDLMAKLDKEFPGVGFGNTGAPKTKARFSIVKPADDDFIPELELPDAIQEPLGLDGQTTVQPGRDH